MFVNKLYTQVRYADLVSVRLNQFTLKQRTPYAANFRCDICGDSSKNKFKKRGYILEKGGSLFYYCHNCPCSLSFESYLKDHQPDLYNQYKFDLLSEMKSLRREVKPDNVEKMQEKATSPLKANYLYGATSVKQLESDHPALLYLNSRQVPLEDVWYTPTFMTYVNQFLPDKFKEGAVKGYEHPRILFPMRRRNREIFGVIGRILEGEDRKYLTIKFVEDENKIFGQEKLDLSKHGYVVEGPLDSKFLPNCIALAGTDGHPDMVFSSKEQYTIVLDNQPRNPEVIGKYSKYILNGHKIVIWPDHIQSKDINDMILSGLSRDDILRLIDNNTYTGLVAQIRFKKWKKV